MITGREGKLYESAARTAAPTQHEEVFIPQGSLGLTVVISTTAASSPSTTPKIQGKSASGVWYDILTGAAITGTGTVVMRVGASLAAVANLAALHPLPANFRVVMTHGNSKSHTYSVDYCIN